MDTPYTPHSGAAQHRIAHKDLRDLISDFEAMGELKRIDGADPHLEIGALAETLTLRFPGEEPALLFDKIKGSKPGYRILSGAANSFRRLAHLYGLPTPETKIDIVKSFKAQLGQGITPIPPKVLATGPVMENVLREGEIDIFKFPIPFIHEHDGGRYIGTEDVVVMKDPDSDWVNAGTYRIMAHAKDEVGIWISPGKHGRFIREKYFKQGKPCPVLICCGQDPILFLCANAELPHGTSELDYAGGQRGAPVEVVLSELHKLPMPAHAEIVLEGEMYGDRLKTEGPFGEFMGYYASEASEQPIIKIRRVYHRNDPIITLAIPSRPPSNFTVARAVVKAAMIWEELEKAGCPGVAGVWNHEAGAGRLFNVVSIKQMYAGHARQAGMLAATCRAGIYAGRWVVVVDEDVDPSNIHDVIWAMSTRCDPANDMEFVHKLWSTPLDPVLRGPPYQSNRAIIDACRPWDWKDEFPRVAEASPELKEKVMKKWAHLFRSTPGRP